MILHKYQVAELDSEPSILAGQPKLMFMVFISESRFPMEREGLKAERWGCHGEDLWRRNCEAWWKEMTRLGGELEKMETDIQGRYFPWEEISQSLRFLRSRDRKLLSRNPKFYT